MVKYTRSIENNRKNNKFEYNYLIICWYCTLWKSEDNLSFCPFSFVGLSFEAGCRRNSTSTLYSAVGYFLCIKDKKMRNSIIIWVCCIKELFWSPICPQFILIKTKVKRQIKTLYCIIYRSSMIWWSSRTLTKLKSQSHKRFNERKYQYLKYKNKNHSGPDT
jgi:hypothetical protein